ncbi:hypothetical protein Goshw_010923 [Gossypium schwendimanii]|uniref:Uncharacterized protein n=1 Tax=Gossypium schwendimanii TaxID=34291 RepID=A0A7J9MZI1_GOSSC|nr:hypothetical protein [Gossypium schwendimanii]
MEEVITFIKGYGREYRDLSANLKYPRPREMISRNAPPSSWVKVNVDVGVLATKQISCKGKSDCNAPWNLVCLRDGFHASNNGKAWERNFSNFLFEYNVHEGNSVAYALVEEGLKRLVDHFWVEDGPMKAKELANSDHRFQQLP